ncbi:MAG: hypothetical protein IAI48_16935 [Candidatus Eremiobacteraeota bacterium]|nr:hypothetical protein [Candidatus Eremiobacteraeota bacterium]
MSTLAGLALSASTAGAGEFAGSGRPGIADGSAQAASFIEPLGLAVDASGNLIVADAGAQRIRLVRPNGQVITIAGSGDVTSDGLGVEGGYADGSALSARFNHPTGVAVDGAGTIVVADTRNHCLRRIVNRTVTTFAGNAATPGSTNGPLAESRFRAPRGVAYAADGTLYVADFGNGVRAISPTGIVKTVAMPGVLGPNVVAVATTVQDGHVVVIATNGVQTVEKNLTTGGWRLWSPNPADANDSGFEAELQGGFGSGTPVAIASLGYDEIVYADPWHDLVSYIGNQFSESLLAPSDDVPEEPAGIAVLPDGRIAVADTGHRKIVTFAAPDRRTYIDPRNLLPAKDPKVFRIAYIGNSYIYHDTTFSDSIPGQIQSQLSAASRKIGLTHPVEVLPVRFGPISGMREWVAEIASDRLVDAVVVQLNSHYVYNVYGVEPWAPISQYESKWLTPFSAEFAGIVASLKAAGIPLAVVTHPIASEMGPDESTYAFEANKGDGLDVGVYGDSRREMERVATNAGVTCTVDTSSAFEESERHVPHEALFGAKDWHETSAARAIIATAAVQLLEKCAPWATATGK